jgi:hypothetical protein
MRRLGQALVALAALLDFGSAWMHGAVARPAVLGRLPSSLPESTIESVNAAWILGTAAMVALGVLALAGLGSIGRDRGAARVPLVAGLFFLGYGGWGFVYRHFHSHFIGFMAIGALFVAGAFFSARERVTS